MIYATQDYPLDYFVVGLIFSVFGLVLIIFHKAIKDWSDDWKSKDFPIGYGKMWSGKYTKAGLFLTYAKIILFGAIFCFIGLVLIIKALSA